MLQAAHAAGVPVPEVLWLGDDPAVLDGRFFVMERIEGETLARRLLREPAYEGARRVMTGQLGAILARDPCRADRRSGLTALPGMRDEGHPAALELAPLRGNLSAPRARAASRDRVRVPLARAASAGRAVGVCWCTATTGSATSCSDRKGVRVVLDWEQAHVGDPMEDLGWMCVRAWRFGSPLPVGGIGERDEFFRAYERAAGDAVDPEVVRFWEAFGDLKWAVICIAQAKTYLDGGVKSLELASIGRRTAEAEHDLLELVD